MKADLQRLLRRLGWTGAAALLLTLLAVAAGAWLPMQQARLDEQRAALSAQRLGLQRQQARTRDAAPAGPAEFTRSLPPDSERQARTAALLALSAELGLPWPRTEFRYQADADLGLAQYRIGMTLTGGYSALRGYVAEALRRDPALALDSLRLTREGSQLRAELTWTLLMQSGSTEGQP